VTVADSLTIYTNLLDEVRRFVLQTDFTETFTVKELASINWKDTIEKARILNAQNITIPTPEQTKKFNELSNFVLRSEGLFRRFEGIRTNTLNEIYRIDSEINSVRTLMLEAAELVKGKRFIIAENNVKNENLVGAQKN
jgi:hypothetical protein